ncbi:hypothetical protein BRC62_04830 [Halobacteriales archaeon QH_10_67_13]|nr:MAG: hypothetical protein BRC62_04830 [Halobacteriales archaeon QH_10_67_13]
MFEVTPLTDPETLADRAVDFGRETNDLPAEVVKRVAALDDMAAVAVESDGKLLLRRLTETCSWKFPVVTVGDGEDYVAALREQVRAAVGPIELERVVTVREITVRSDESDRTASRTFVTFTGRLNAGTEPVELPVPEDGAHEVGWFAELPDEADELPGTAAFFDGLTGRR